MYKMVWLVAFIHSQAGPQVAPIAETTTFKDEAACMAFGKEMSPRVMDYARGAAGLDWGDAVSVHYRCTDTSEKS